MDRNFLSRKHYTRSDSRRKGDSIQALGWMNFGWRTLLPQLFSGTSSSHGSMNKGAVVGAVGALAVGGLAVGAVTLGAPVAIVTGVFGVAAAVGGGFTLYDTAQQASNGNWAGVAYNVGTIGGSAVAGGATSLARGSGRASRGRRPAGASARTGSRAIAPITQVARSANGSVPGPM
jgi:hypothetical protein